MINSNGDSKPAISVIIIDSRSDIHPEWVNKAIDSVKTQSLQNIELIVLKNIDKKCTIGAMYNRGVELAESDWVYFLGDDDFVSPDFFASLTTFIERFVQDDKYVAASTYSTFFDDEKQKMSINTMTPFGAFRKSYLVENPLNENINKYIDVDIYKRFDRQGYRAKICRWHFGYYYRSHGEQVSGRKNIKLVSEN